MVIFSQIYNIKYPDGIFLYELPYFIEEKLSLYKMWFIIFIRFKLTSQI